jgi:aspartyl aminopeptidase
VTTAPLRHPLAHDLCAFVHQSPSPWHAVATAAARLAAAGHAELDPGAEWPELPPGSRWMVRRDGSLVAWTMGAGAPAACGFRVIGAHTDSPTLRLKPRPEGRREGYLCWGVEVYGGVLLHTWLDRELGLSGRVAVRGPAGVQMRLVRVDEPLARIPSLAIHLNREVNTEGLKLNTQTHLPPLVALAGDDDPGLLRGLLAGRLEVDPADLLGWELMLHEVNPPVVGGARGDFVFAPRLDNLASCHAAVTALLRLDAPGESTACIALFDHEEVGSTSAHGADGRFFADLLQRIDAHATARASGGLARAAAHSLTISADMAHGVHPNYADRHEPAHKPVINGGPVIKANANQRYATSAETAARFRLAGEAVGVPVQDFVTRTDLACGSTIGPLNAAWTAARTVDVGNPMLSMHSARELCGAADAEMMVKVMARLLREG